jgi:hypothetical protein
MKTLVQNCLWVAFDIFVVIRLYEVKLKAWILTFPTVGSLLVRIFLNKNVCTEVKNFLNIVDD